LSWLPPGNKGWPARPRADGRLVLAALLCAALHGCAQRLSPEETQEAGARLGRAQAAVILQSQVLLCAPDVQGRCEEITDKILRAAGSRRTCRIHIVNAAVENALALPSGDIIVFTGILDLVGSNDELALVLAHEVSHVLHGDGVRVVQKAILTSKRAGAFAAILGTTLGNAMATFVGVKVASPMPAESVIAIAWETVKPMVASQIAYAAMVHMSAQAAYAVGQGLLRDYGRAVESRADAQAKVLAARAGFDPRALDSLRTKLAESRARAKAAARGAR